MLDATADNAFTLYLDGKPVATGEDWHTTQSFETKLAIGPHVLAAVASNEAPGPAGFLVRGGVLPLGQGVPIHTNSSWKTSGTVPAGDDWTKIGFDDSSWVRAADLGPLGSGPWGALGHQSRHCRAVPCPSGFPRGDGRLTQRDRLRRRIHFRSRGSSLRFDRTRPDRPADR